jgi:hypothetical protein
MNNGDHSPSFSIWKYFKIGQSKKPQSNNDKIFKDFEKAHFKEDFSYETMSRGKLSD